MPGPYPGKVVEVHHPNCILSGQYQAAPVEQMMRKGMLELTGAPGWPDAWRALFEKGDVVAIKVSPVGGPKLCSDALVLNQVIDGLKQAGVSLRDIVVFSRYRAEIRSTGIVKWLPPGVRWDGASEEYNEAQLDMNGYDPDHFMEMALINPGENATHAHFPRPPVPNGITPHLN